MRFLKISFLLLAVLLIVCGCNKLQVDNPLSDNLPTDSGYQSAEDEISADIIGDTDNKNEITENSKVESSIGSSQNDDNSSCVPFDNKSDSDETTEESEKTESVPSNNSDIEYENNSGWSSGWN